VLIIRITHGVWVIRSYKRCTICPPDYPVFIGEPAFEEFRSGMVWMVTPGLGGSGLRFVMFAVFELQMLVFCEHH
jgi:hypothetical protein